MGKLNIQTLGSYKKTGNPHQIKFETCPYCNNQKYKFYVHLKKGVFHCHRCKVGGRIEKLETPLDSFREKVAKFLEPEPKFIVKKNPKVVLPKEYVFPILPKHGIPWRYLKNRGINGREMDFFKIGYCSSGIYEDRIIIPIYNDGVLVYFLGRSFGNREPKYVNATCGKDNVIFKTFEGTVGHAVVVEGVFDALRVSKVFPAIALLGKTITQGQIQQIKDCAKTVTVMLDPDAGKYAIEVYNSINYSVPAKIKLLDEDLDTDPGSMTPETILEKINTRRK